MRLSLSVFALVKGHVWAFPQSELWAHVDLNHGPHPYQGCALTGLSYGPQLVVKESGIVPAATREAKWGRYVGFGARLLRWEQRRPR